MASSCGTSRTASITTSCTSPAAAASRCACARWWASSRSSRWRLSSPTSWTVCPVSSGACSGSSTTGPTSRVTSRRSRRTTARAAFSRPVAVPQGAPVRDRRHGHGAPRRLRAGRVVHGPLRRQFELARACLVSRELPHHRVAAEVSPFPGRFLSGRVPDSLGREVDAVGRRQRALAPPHPHLPARRERPAARLRRRRDVPDRSSLARLHPFLRVLPRRHRRRDRREPPDRLDRAGREAASAERRMTAGTGEPDGREWLEANGLGGYAMSTVTGENTRRYHGLLVAATKPPVSRAVLLSKV